MSNIFNIFFRKKIVGVDIGTSAVKLVEISRLGNVKTLENYGEVKSALIQKEPLPNGKSGNMPSNDLLSLAIKEILGESRIKTKAVIFSIPDFSTFCTSFEIPPMTEKEIPGAIRFNASQYITLPIGEVTLDWQIIPKSPDDKNSLLKVFLVAVPNQIVEDYKAIAKGAGLELYALEAEVLGITRALVKDNKKTLCLVDMGVQSSTISIIDKGFLKKSYSFSFNGNQLQGQDVVKNLQVLVGPLLVGPLLAEIKNVSAEFFQQEQREVQEVYLTGGTANLPGLKEYFQESLKKNVYFPNCFSGLLYNPILDLTLKGINPRFSAAVGVALGGLET